MAKDDDSDPIGPDDGTIEMDRDAMMRRYKEARVTDKMPAVEETEETQSIAVPAELLQMTRDGSFGPKTIDVILEEVPDDDTATVTANVTQPLGPVRYLEFIAMVDETGAVQLPGPCLQTPGFRPGSTIRVRIETVEDD